MNTSANVLVSVLLRHMQIFNECLNEIIIKLWPSSTFLVQKNTSFCLVIPNCRVGSFSSFFYLGHNNLVYTLLWKYQSIGSVDDLVSSRKQAKLEQKWKESEILLRNIHLPRKHFFYKKNHFRVGIFFFSWFFTRRADFVLQSRTVGNLHKTYVTAVR